MADPIREEDDATPRWVKVCGAIAIVFVLVFAGIHLAGGGFHHHMGGAAVPEAPAPATQP